MEKEFVPYELAWELKQLNFDETCFGYYHNLGSTQLVVSKRDLRADNNDGIEYCLAPLYQQAFRWFREKHGLVGIVKFGTNDFTYNIYNTDGIGLLTKESLNFNGTYEEAESDCLQKLIEIVKTK